MTDFPHLLNLPERCPNLSHTCLRPSRNSGAWPVDGNQQKLSKEKKTMSRVRFIVPMGFALILALSFMAGPAPAQSIAATVSGTVNDTSGAVVPNAKVDLTNASTHQTRTLRTDESGLFVAPDV